MVNPDGIGEDKGGFQTYVITTIDPGNSMLIGSIVFSVLLLLLLPCLVSIGRRFQRHEPLDVGGTPTDQEVDSSQSPKTPPNGEDDPEKQNKKKKKQKKSSVDRPYGCPYLNQGQLDDSGNHSSSSSVQSKGSSTVSSVGRAVVNAILDSSPHGGPYRHPQQIHVEQQHRKTKPNHMENDPTTAEENDTGSVMGRLSHDAVSIRDAVDAHQGTAPVKGTTTAIVMSPWERLLTIAEWDYESKRLTKLGIPFIGQALLEGVVEAVHVGLIGRFVGTRALTAYVSVELLVGLTTSILKGFQESITTLCSQALGHGNRRLVGQYVQIATILYVVCYVPVFLFWLVFIGDALRWLGFDEETVKMGYDFTMLFLFAHFLSGLDFSAHSLLDVIGKEKYSTFFRLGQELVKTGGLLAVALQPGIDDLQLIGLVFIAAEALGLAVNVIIIVCNGWFDKFLGGMVGSFALKVRYGLYCCSVVDLTTAWEQNVKATKILLGTSASLSLGQLLAYGEWELLTIFASFLGPAEVAAWGLLGTLWDAVELVTEAVADAAEVRTAYLLGAGEPEKAKTSAYKAIFLAIFAAVFITSLLFICGNDIPTWLTTDPTLQRLTFDLLPLFGLGNIALTIGTMSWTIVGAQGRYRLATGVGFGGSWLLSIPLAAVLSIWLKFDLKGQTAAVVIGYMVSGTINSYILLQSDWPKLSRRVIATAAEAADSDSDDDDSSSSSSDDDNDDDDGNIQNKKPAPVITERSQPDAPTTIESNPFGIEVATTLENLSRSLQNMFTTASRVDDKAATTSSLKA